MSACNCTTDPLALAVAECTRLLKAENLDAWLSLLLARAAARPALLGTWAVVAETARLPWRLHEPLLCRLRMEFWRAAAAGEETPALPGNMAAPLPLLALLPPALPRDDLAEALAQLALLADGAFDAADDLLQWSEAAFTPLWRTLLLATSVERSGAKLVNPPDVQAPGMDAALRALARAFGVGFLLRRAAWPRRCTQAPLLGGAMAEQETVAALIARARADFATARAERWPRRLLPALLPASLMHHWLQQAARQQPDFPNRPAPSPSQLARQWLLLRRWLAGRL